MRKESVSRNTAATGYVLSQEGHLRFQRIRDHLQLLDRMTHARVVHDIPDLGLTPDELLTHFFFLLRDLDAVSSDMRVQTRQ